MASTVIALFCAPENGPTISAKNLIPDVMTTSSDIFIKLMMTVSIDATNFAIDCYEDNSDVSLHFQNGFSRTIQTGILSPSATDEVSAAAPRG